MTPLHRVIGIIGKLIGDIALDHAVEIGFKTAPLERHATLGIIPMSLMLVLAVLHAGSTDNWVTLGAGCYVPWRLSGQHILSSPPTTAVFWSIVSGGM